MKLLEKFDRELNNDCEEPDYLIKFALEIRIVMLMLDRYSIFDDSEESITGIVLINWLCPIGEGLLSLPWN